MKGVPTPYQRRTSFEKVGKRFELDTCLWPAKQVVRLMMVASITARYIYWLYRRDGLKILYIFIQC